MVEPTFAAAVESILLAAGVPIERVGDDPGVLQGRYADDEADWPFVVLVDEESSTVVMHSLLGVEPAPDRRDQVIEFLVRASSGLDVGSFDYDFENDEVSFRVGIDLTGDRPSEALLTTMVHRNLMVAGHYRPWLERVAAGVQSAEHAARAADGA